jgi:hypothetical protein
MRIANDLALRVFGRLIWVALAVSMPVCAQTGSLSAGTSPDGQADLNGKIEALTVSLDQTRAELSESREEIRQLRGMLEQVMQKVGPLNATAPGATVATEAPAGTPAKGSQQTVANEPKSAQITEDDWEIANSRLQELAQDKVESSLKYRVRLSGIALLNAFSVSGQVDNLDVPSVALSSFPGESSGSVGASLRQTVLGLAGTGPDIFGAKTSGDVQMDFFGGLPAGYGSESSGLVRLRLARLRFDWENTSIVGGLDVPFFSPNMPTSYMSIAEPSFAAAGNLWTWTPMIRVEQRINTDSTQFKIEAGVMDPAGYGSSGTSARYPNASESSRRPTVAVRLSVGRKDENRPITFGVSGIYSPQQYASAGTTVSGWGTVADWKIALLPRTELSGEFFVGKGLDSFGGVPGPFIQPQNLGAYYGSGAPAALASITMAGGWSQFKVRVNSRNEFNVAVGTGGRNASDLRYEADNYLLLGNVSPRNDLFLVNYIFRPRSDLVFSPEFRRLRTFQISGPPVNADQAGIAAGFLF